MIKNTPENKAKFFALYLNQRVFWHEEYGKEVAILDSIKIETRYGYLVEGYKLLLTPLSQITDEDAIEIAKILNPELYPDPKFKISKGYSERGHNISENVLCIEVKNLIPFPIERYYLWSLIQIDLEENEVITGSFENDGDLLVDDHSENILHVYDYLRSRGYALPWFGLSVEELVNRGWVKLKEAIKCSD